MRTLFLKIDDKLGILTILYYLFVGGISAAINFGSFAIFWDVFHIYYKVAVTISYCLAILFNFTCNRHFTFKSSGAYLIRHASRYITMILLNYALTMMSVHIAVEEFSLSPYIGLLASIAITTITGFTLSKFWVFNKKSSD